MKTIQKMTVRAAVASLAFGLVVSCNNSPSEDSKEHADKMNDEKFDNQGEKDADRLNDLHAANLYEIAASQDASTKASAADTKKVAEMMVQAHTKMDKELQELAMKKNVTLTGDMTNDQKGKMDKLANKTGMDYDKEYLDQMKDAHDDAEKKLEHLSDKAEDAEVKAFAAKGLPEIRSHKDMIVSTRDAVKDMKDDARKDEKANKDHTDHGANGHAH